MAKFTKEKFKPLHIKIDVSLECKICNKILKSIPGLATHVINIHDLTYKEYLKKMLNINIDNIYKEWNDGKEDRQNNRRNAFKKYTDSIKGITIKERMTPEKYDSFRKNMIGVFTKEWFIKKYGDKVGLEKYKERSEQVSKISFFRKYNLTNKENFSKVSQELFWEIHKRISQQYKKIYFGELNHEYGCETNTNFDFVVIDNKKIIEFNGDKFHANPNLFSENEIPLQFLNKTAKEIWKEDNDKHEKAIIKGYTIKTIWETEYYKNKEKIILECIDFINEI